MRSKFYDLTQAEALRGTSEINRCAKALNAEMTDAITFQAEVSNNTNSASEGFLGEENDPLA